MRDWRANVREQLGTLRLAPAEAEEVLDELAGHLEECYDALRAQGMAEEEAYKWTCACAGNWGELRQAIVSATEVEMIQDRVRQIWLPSLITLMCAWGLLAILMWAGVQPIMTRPAEPLGLIFYFPWLVVLPAIGAVGGYLSRRAMGRGWRVYLAGVFPVVAIAIVFLLVIPFSLVVDRHVALAIKFSALAAGMFSWVVMPGIALCVGVALEGLRRPRTA